MTQTVKMLSGKMEQKKKKKKTDLHVVEGGGPEAPEGKIPWGPKLLTDKLKKTRKRVKKLENAVKLAEDSRDALAEKNALLEKQIETVDLRTQRMTTALRECMKKLGVERPK